MNPTPARESLHENALDTWARRCARWKALLSAAQLAGDAAEIAKAELSLAICERERARVEALFGTMASRPQRRAGEAPRNPPARLSSLR